MLASLHHTAARAVARRCGPDERYVELTPDMLEGVTPNQIRDAFLRASTPKPEPRIDLFHVAPIRVSVMDTVGHLCSELPTLGRTSFRDLTAQLVERMEVIVHFLAVLELFKQGLVDLRQPARFGDIEVLWQGPDKMGGEELEMVDVYDG